MRPSGELLVRELSEHRLIVEEKEEDMLIRVIYSDNRFDLVKDTQLDRLIQERSITMFQRKSGWVRVGIDPVRQRSRGAASRKEKGRNNEGPKLT